MEFARRDGVLELFYDPESDDVTRRQQALYDMVAAHYDGVFSQHVTEHYLDKRADVVEELLPYGGLVLDVGCGTGALADWIQRRGYSVYGVDVSTGMLREALSAGISGAFAGFSTALPFASDTFDLALSVATMHHLETPQRVSATIEEMGRVVKRGGYVVVSDHNPLNPYWPLLMKRVPQDHGDERLVSMSELVGSARGAGLEIVRACRAGFVPDFMPAGVMPAWRWVEGIVESTPVLNILAAHNVLVARRP
jgi:SAM-dependent methyltransferase